MRVELVSLPRLRSWSCVAASLLTFCASFVGPAWAVTPAELLTPELERRSISLSHLAGGQLSYFDPQRRLTQSRAGDYVRLSINASAEAELDTAATATSAAPLMIELVDGQRLAGRWGGAARDGDAIVWVHPALGQFTFGLDEVRRITRRAAAERGHRSASLSDDASASGSDRLLMNNGDQLVGFVLAVEAAAVMIQPDGADEGLAFPIENVARLTLANPSAAVTVAGDLLTLADGSRIRGTGVGIAGDTLRFTPSLADAMQPVERPLDELRTIEFAASGLRLIDLAEQPVEVETGTAFGLPVAPNLRDGALRLRAPMTLRFALPPGVQRFSAQAALNLPEGMSAERARWSNVGLTIGFGEQSDASTATNQRWVFGPDHPAAAIELSPSTAGTAEAESPEHLVLVVDPAANGPVLDRLRITEAVLLVAQPPVQPGSKDPDQ